MAYGVRCLNCGWMETDHGNGGNVEDDHDPAAARPDYSMSLEACGDGYVPGDPEDELTQMLSEERLSLMDRSGTITAHAIRMYAYCGGFEGMSDPHGMAERLARTFEAR